MTELVWRPDRAFEVSPDGSEVWSFTAAGPIRLAGSNAGALARAVDSGRTRDEVIEVAVAAGMERADAERILDKWLTSGHLVPVGTLKSAAPPMVRVIDATIGRDAEVEAFAAALAQAGVHVERGNAPAEAGRAVARGEPVTAVVVVDDLLRTAQAMADAESAAAVAVAFSGDRVMVAGPLASTRRGCCPTCLESRLSSRRTADLVAARRLGRRWPPPLPVRHRAAPVIAAGLVAALVSGDREEVANIGTTVTSADVSGAPPLDSEGRGSARTVQTHRVVPVPGCPACDPLGVTVVASHGDGQPGLQRLDDAGSDEVYRVADPLSTWTRFRHLISDVVGVVPYVEPTGPPEMRTYSAGANPAAQDDLLRFKSRLRSASGGKGLSLAAARTGALAEALERDSLRARGNEPHLHARARDLPDRHVLPNDIQLFSERQLDEADLLAALGVTDEGAGTGFHRIPRRFDAELAHDWSAVARWRTGETVWLPSSLLWFNWPGLPPGYPTGCSNGAAAGNTLAEALLQGLLELVERDSVGMWWLTRSRRPAFDLASWDDPRVASALAPQQALGGEVWVLDVTSDIGIPAAAAVAVDWTPHTRAPLLGFGAHIDPALAVVRALTELAQMQAPVVASEGHILRAPQESPEAAWFDEVRVEDEPWLAPVGWTPPPPAPAHSALGEAIDEAVTRIESCGVEVLWADCTRPDVGLPVVRTWAPGLRHFWNRYGPGRLYDVPPALGWCQPGYTEDDLNPRPMIL